MEPSGGAEQVVPYISERTIAELKEYYPGALPEETKSLPEALSQINALTGKSSSSLLMNGMFLFVTKTCNAYRNQSFQDKQGTSVHD